MKFLADMGISLRVVDELRRNGHDAVHLVELGLERLADHDILQIMSAGIYSASCANNLTRWQKVRFAV
ncbi:MAG: DUF5615 family PIN-like protein [Chloroflexota bacterium]